MRGMPKHVKKSIPMWLCVLYSFVYCDARKCVFKTNNFGRISRY